MKRSTVLGAFVATAAAAALPHPAFAQEAVKVAFVDLKRAVAETEEGRRATSAIKKEFEQKQKELDEIQDELRKAVQDLDKKRTLLPAEAVRQKEGELQKKMQDAQQTYLRHQQTLAEKEGKSLRPIIDRMQRIIAKIGQADGFSMVFDREQAGIVFAKPHLDLTNELIRRFNSGEGGNGKPTAKAPAGPPPKPKK